MQTSQTLGTDDYSVSLSFELLPASGLLSSEESIAIGAAQAHQCLPQQTLVKAALAAGPLLLLVFEQTRQVVLESQAVLSELQCNEQLARNSTRNQAGKE